MSMFVTPYGDKIDSVAYATEAGHAVTATTATTASTATTATSASSATQADLATNFKRLNLYQPKNYSDFIVETKQTPTFSISVNDWGTLDITKSGYYPIAIVGYEIYNNSQVILQQYYITESNGAYKIKWGASTYASSTLTNQYITFYVLYIRYSS